MLDSAPDLTPFLEEDRKRICFYTNEIAKLTERLSATSSGNRTRVLLVDDESLVRRTLKQILATYQDVELVGRQLAVMRPWRPWRDFNQTSW